MPVSWQSRLSVRSATEMLLIITPRMPCARASRSRAASASNPDFTSGGSSLSARRYSAFATSSIVAGSMRSIASVRLDLALAHDLLPQRALGAHRARELVRRVADRRETLHEEPCPHVARVERLHGVAVHLVDDLLRRTGRRDDAEPAVVLEAGETLVHRRHVGQLRRALLARYRERAQLAAVDEADRSGEVRRRHGDLPGDEVRDRRPLPLVGHVLDLEAGNVEEVLGREVRLAADARVPVVE